MNPYPSELAERAFEFWRTLSGRQEPPTAAEFYRNLEMTRLFASVAHPFARSWTLVSDILEPLLKPHPLAHPIFHAWHHVYRDFSAHVNNFAFQFEPRRDKPEWGINEVVINGETIKVVVEEVHVDGLTDMEGKAGTLRKFKLVKSDQAAPNPDAPPKMPALLVAPISGHWATLLRNMVRDTLESGEYDEVVVTDWNNPRDVRGLWKFGVDQHITLAMKYMNHFKGNVQIFAVCQPGPIWLSAVSLMHQINEQFKKLGKPLLHTPFQLTVMGSPIDTDKSPQEPNRFARSHSILWFIRNVVCQVPKGFGFKGAGDWVYCGGLQGFAFMSMKKDWHRQNVDDRYARQVAGDPEGAKKRDPFYHEYWSFMDVGARLYLQTVYRFFQKNLLAKGKLKWSGTIAGQTFKKMLVKPSAIKHTSIATVEGGQDDITGLGQCAAAGDLCSGLPQERKMLHVEKMAGHYKIFDGALFKKHILPALIKFARAQKEYVARHNPGMSGPQSVPAPA